MTTTTNWKGGNGNWQTAAKWTAGAPTSPTSFAVINAPGTYTINIGSGLEYHVGAVSLNDAGATLAVAGVLTLKNQLTLFKGELDLSGKIEGGSIAAQGGSIVFLGGTLDDVDYRGTLNLETSGMLTIADGMTLHGANGSGKGAIMVGGGSHLTFSGTQTLNNANLTIDGGTVDIQNGKLTFGPAMSVLYKSKQNTFAETKGTIVNRGTLNFAGGALATFNSIFTNSGKLTLAGGSKVQFAADVTNSGQFTVASGATTDFGNVSNSGQFIVTGNTTALLGNVSQFSNTDEIDVKKGAGLNSSSISNSGRIVVTGGSLFDNTLVNSAAGRITLFAGSQFFVSTLENSGVLTANGATIYLGNTATDSLGTLNIQNSTISFRSVNIDDDSLLIDMLANQNNQVTTYCNINNSGNTLDLTMPAGFKSFTYDGTISGGTVQFEAGFTGNLTDLTVQGPLTVNLGSLYLSNVTFVGAGGTGTGTVDLSNSTITLPGTAFAADIDNVDIESTGTSGLESYAQNVPRQQRSNPFALTLGSNLTVTSSGDFSITATSNYVVQPTVVANNGTLQENGSGTFEIHSRYFYNYGTVDVENGGKFIIDSRSNSLGGGKFDIAANSTLSANTVTLLQANVDLEGKGATFQCAGLSVIYGVLTIGSGAVVDIGPTLAIDGTLNLEGSSVSTSKFTVSAGGILGGHGKVVGTVANSGTIDASGGTLSISQDVTGTGQVTIEDGATMSFNGDVAAGQTVTFQAATGTLGLGFASGFAGTIAAFAPGDTIDLIGTAATGATYNAATDILTIKNKGALVATLKLSGDYTGDKFTLTGDGKGGTDIAVAAATPAALHRFVEAIAASSGSGMASGGLPASLDNGAFVPSLATSSGMHFGH